MIQNTHAFILISSPRATPATKERRPQSRRPLSISQKELQQVWFPSLSKSSIIMYFHAFKRASLINRKHDKIKKVINKICKFWKEQNLTFFRRRSLELDQETRLVAFRRQRVRGRSIEPISDLLDINPISKLRVFKNANHSEKKR